MDNDETGARIREARKNKKITQKQLAKILNKSESSIQKYESGEVEIPNSVLEDIAKALDTTTIYLLIGREEAQLEKELNDIFDEYTAFENEDPDMKLFRQQLKYFGFDFEAYIYYIEDNKPKVITCISINEAKKQYPNYDIDIEKSYYQLTNKNNTFKVSVNDFDNLRENLKLYIQFMLQEFIKKYK